MIKKVTTIIIISLLLVGLIYQNRGLSDARMEAVGRYTSSIYHLQRVNDILLDKIKSGQCDKVELQGFANRCIDLGIISHDLGIPAENYYTRLTSGLKELADTIDADKKGDREKLTQEITFLLESLRELYSLINRETEDNINKMYKRIYTSTEINRKASEYLASQERSYYK